MTREEVIAEIERQQGIVVMTKFKCDDCGEEIWYRQLSKNDTFECKCKTVIPVIDIKKIRKKKRKEDGQQDSQVTV